MKIGYIENSHIHNAASKFISASNPQKKMKPQGRNQLACSKPNGSSLLPLLL